MTTKRVLDTTTILAPNVTYVHSGGNDYFTKSGGADGDYNAGVVGKDGLILISNDQSVRILLRAIDKGLRFGFAQLPSPIGTVPYAYWVLVPEIADVVSFSDDFATDFGTPDYDTSKWGVIGSPSSIIITGGALRVSGSSSCGLRSVNTFDFTSKAVSMKIPANTSNGNVANGFLISASDSFTTYWGMDEYNGQLRCANQNSIFFSTAYNAVNHLYKRIRFSGSTVYFDTSPDGITWTNVASGASAATRTALYVYLRPYFAAAHSVDFDDVKVLTVGQTKRYEAWESGVLKFTSARVPSNDDELRIQIVLDSGSYKLKYYWRDDSGSSEQLEYTSAITSAALQNAFPLVAKGEIYNTGGELANLQLEGDNFGLFSIKQGNPATRFVANLESKLGQLDAAGDVSMQMVYTGDNLTEAQDGLAYFRANGDPLTTFKVWTNAANAFDDTVFRVTKNGVEIQEITVLQGENYAEVTGLAEITANGDVIQLDLKTPPSLGNVSAPITFEANY